MVAPAWVVMQTVVDEVGTAPLDQLAATSQEPFSPPVQVTVSIRRDSSHSKPAAGFGGGRC